MCLHSFQVEQCDHILSLGLLLSEHINVWCGEANIQKQATNKIGTLKLWYVLWHASGMSEQFL